MATTIDFEDTNKINWTDSDDFLYFAFGDFNSADYGLFRTSNSNRYTINLSPPTKDLTAEVPGGDGQYYFGTYYQPKVFDVNFSFEGLRLDQINTIKNVFSGKEIKELCFSEDCEHGITMDGDTSYPSIVNAKIYMAKVTGQPNIKTIAFNDGQDEKYSGEGTIQFTAYWPYARSYRPITNRRTTAAGATETEFTLTNNGIDTYFSFEASSGSKVTKIEIDNDNYVSALDGEYIESWDSKTGIIKSSKGIIGYESKGQGGLMSIPTNGVKITVSHQDTTGNKNLTFSYYQWYC